VLPVVGYPAEIWRHRYLVQNFFRRELLGRFRGSALGLVWVLVHPMFQFAVYFLVFGFLFNKTGEPPSMELAVYLFSGVIAFSALNEGLMRACTSVVDNGNLVKKVAFPSQLLPVPVVMVSLLVYLVGAVVCLGVGWSTGVLQPGWSLLALPVVLLVQATLTIGLGLFLANAQVFARDVSHLWGIVSMSWMFLSPVFWFPYQLGSALGDGFRAALEWNPLYALLMAHRIALGATDAVVAGQLVAFGDLGGHLVHAGVWALGFLLLGYSIFMSRRHQYADHV
jgi:lipopolysaccharide transport system permease protein